MLSSPKPIKQFYTGGIAWTNVILYDGVCNFCNGCVNVVRKYDGVKKFSFAPLQSVEGKEICNSIGKSKNHLSSVVYVRINKEGELEIFDKSDAVICVIEELLGVPKLLISLIRTIVPKTIRDTLYDVVATNRYRIMGKKEDCGCTSRPP